jgi:protein O-mannosyl-transferase
VSSVLRQLLPAALLGVLLALAYAAYSPGLSGPWLLDDAVNIRPAVLQELTWAQIHANIFASPRLGGFSRSLSMLSLALTEYVYGADTLPYKHQNLLLHLANALLVFWFVRLLFLAAGKAQDTKASWVALATTALWMLHPLQVSTVLYVVQRLVLLSAFFSLLALCLYVEARLLSRTRPIAGTTLALTALGLCWPLAVVSKENAVLLVLVVPLLELFVLRLKTHSPCERKLLRRTLAVFIAVPLAIGILYALMRGEALLIGYAGRDFNVQERLMTEAHVMWLYLSLIAFPIPGHMTLYHDAFPVQRVLDVGTIMAAGALFSAVIAAFLLRHRAPLVGFGLSWFFCWHLIESTFLPLELVFEHRNYLPLMGLTLALVAGSRRLYEVDKLKVPLAGAALALVALLSLNTAARAFVWSSFPLMAEADYEHHSLSPRVLEGLIVVESRRGRPERALRYVKELQQVAPDAAFPWLREALIRCDLPGGAADAFAQALDRARTERLRPATTTLTRQLIAKVHTGGCHGVSRDDVVSLAAVLNANPRIHTTSTRLAALSTYAMASILNGDTAAAEETVDLLIATAYTQSPAKFADTIEVAAMVASQLPTQDAAIAFLDRLTRDYADVLSHRRMRVYLTNPMSIDEPAEASPIR